MSDSDYDEEMMSATPPPIEQEEQEANSGSREGTPLVDPEIEKLAVKLVRVCLALNLNSQPLSSKNLRDKAFGTETVHVRKFELALKRADNLLRDVYGYCLWEMPPKETVNPKGRKTISKTKQWIVLNVMRDGYLRFHQEADWLRTSVQVFGSELMEQRRDYRNSKEHYPHLSTEYDLMFRGLALAIVMVIIVSNNHVTQEELFRVLHNSFGFDTTEPLKIINLTLIDLLKQLDKQEYVNRIVTRTDTEEVAEYTAGRRGLMEMDKEAFTDLTRILYDENEQRDEFTKLIDATVGAAYNQK